MGIWGTASPMGNVVGSVISPIVLMTFGCSWKVLIIISGGFLMLVGIAITFLEDAPSNSLSDPINDNNDTQSQPKFLEILNLPG
jgi:uncharacterized membrane protein